MLTLLLTVFLTNHIILVQCSSLLCGSNLYGVPSLSDSLTVASRLPYVKEDPDGEMDLPRIFAEPSFFQPKFRTMQNTWPSKMVQLPTIWRYSQCLQFERPNQPMENADLGGKGRLAWRYCFMPMAMELWRYPALTAIGELSRWLRPD